MSKYLNVRKLKIVKPSKSIILSGKNKRGRSAGIARSKRVDEALAASNLDVGESDLALFRRMFGLGKVNLPDRSNEQLRALAARLHQLLEEERIEIAREVHDSLGGSLTGMGMDLANLKSRLAESLKPSLKDSIAAQIDRLSADVEGLMEQVRSLATKLRPPVLDELGLAAAMAWLSEDFERRSSVQCELDLDPRVEVGDDELATAVFRIYQEALTNVARHANATKVLVRMFQDRGRLLLEISDNGRGITVGKGNRSLGLMGMRERAFAHGGTIDIKGQAGRGTTLTVVIPQQKRAQNEQEKRNP